MIETLLFIVGLLIGAIILFFIGQQKAVPIIKEKNELAMGLAAKTSELTMLSKQIDDLQDKQKLQIEEMKSQYAQQIDYLKEQHELQVKKEQLEQKKKELQEEKKAVSDNDYIEEQARKQLKMIKPGEILYVLPDDDDKSNDPKKDGDSDSGSDQ